MDGKSIMEVLNETGRDMKFDKITMHELEALSIPKVKELKPIDLKRMREKARFSQNAMAICLNVKPSTYQKWEQGRAKPTGSSMKLLNIVYKNGIESVI